MKKKITYILISTFLINSLLFLFIYPFLIQSLKGRFKEKSLKTMEMVNKVIVISESDYVKLQFVGDDEFIYEGNLYDIIKQTKDNGKLVFHCYHDKEEEAVKKEFDNNMSRKKKENINQINVFTFYAVIEFIDKSIISDKKLSSFTHILPVYYSYISDIPFPPPRNIS